MDGRRDPIEIMRDETRVRIGVAPPGIGSVSVPPGTNCLTPSEFLMREPRMAAHYRQGEGITLERGPGLTEAEALLYLHGSIYSAIAAINGLLPLHASAVAVDGKLIAFTGPAGAGKSTLVAALGHLGLPLFCDDTLLLDLAAPGPAMGLPGHRRVKLWADSLELTGSAALELVSDDYPKFYVTRGGGDIATPLPLAALVLLERGAEPAIEPIFGSAKLIALKDDHYARQMFESLHAQEAVERLAIQARLAKSMKIFRFVRSLDRSDFWISTRYLAARLSGMVSG